MIIFVVDEWVELVIAIFFFYHHPFNIKYLKGYKLNERKFFEHHVVLDPFLLLRSLSLSSVVLNQQNNKLGAAFLHCVCHVCALMLNSHIPFHSDSPNPDQKGSPSTSGCCNQCAVISNQSPTMKWNIYRIAIS